jgi:branched-chain amino acid transport system substrate-binding protein
MNTQSMTRRQAMGVIGAGAALATLPSRSFAAGMVSIGTLCPVTGSGASYGGLMEHAARRQIDQMNKLGVANGMQVKGVYENSETDPNAAVVAAKKLASVDKVSAIIGEWSSGETLAVSPICIANKIVQMTCAGDDKITEQDHQGYIFRTEPGGVLWGKGYAEAAWTAGARRVAIVSVQASYAVAYTGNFKKFYEGMGGTVIGEPVFYAGNATTYQGELEKVLSGNPDLVFILGYTPDTGILLKEAYQSGAKNKWLVPGYVGLDPELVKSTSADALEGLFAIDPTPNKSSNNWQTFVQQMGGDDKVSAYAAETYDQATLVGLAIEATKQPDGTSIRDGIRKVTAAGGTVVTSLEQGVQALRAGSQIKYEGVSSPCEFDAKGNITVANFSFYEMKGGKAQVLETKAVRL